jgi:hypothetical protein
MAGPLGLGGGAGEGWRQGQGGEHPPGKAAARQSARQYRLRSLPGHCNPSLLPTGRSAQQKLSPGERKVKLQTSDRRGEGALSSNISCLGWKPLEHFAAEAGYRGAHGGERLDRRRTA